MKSIELYRNIFKESFGSKSKRLVYFNEGGAKIEGPKSAEAPKSGTGLTVAQAGKQVDLITNQAIEDIQKSKEKTPPEYVGVIGDITSAAGIAQKDIRQNADNAENMPPTMLMYVEAYIDLVKSKHSLPSGNNNVFSELKSAENKVATLDGHLKKLQGDVPSSLQIIFGRLEEKMQAAKKKAAERARELNKQLETRISFCDPVLNELKKQNGDKDIGGKQAVGVKIDSSDILETNVKPGFDTLMLLQAALLNLKGFMKQLEGVDSDLAGSGAKGELATKINKKITDIKAWYELIEGTLAKKDPATGKRWENFKDSTEQLDEANVNHDRSRVETLNPGIKQERAYFEGRASDDRKNEIDAIRSVMDRVRNAKKLVPDDMNQLKATYANLKLARTVLTTAGKPTAQIDQELSGLGLVIENAEKKFPTTPAELQKQYQTLQNEVAELNKKHANLSITPAESNRLVVAEKELQTVKKDLQLSGQIGNNKNDIKTVLVKPVIKNPEKIV